MQPSELGIVHEYPQSRYSKAVNFVNEVVGNDELGYVYTFPDKRLYNPVKNSEEFIRAAWANYNGEVGVYVHVPYCTPKPSPPEVKIKMNEAGITQDGRDHLCGYCNLYTTVVSEVPSTFSQGVINEIALMRNVFSKKNVNSRSIYFGGGTPSLLELDDLKSIFNTIIESFGEVPQDKEIAIECAPDSVTHDKLKALKGIGFNRVSVGVQSFDEKVLHYTGRNYDSGLGYKAIKDALDVGFANVNGDLIIGLPFSTGKSFLKDVATMIELSPPTITMYQDMTRPITRFGKMAEHGILPQVSQREIYEWTKIGNSMLQNAGYERKSLTTWAKEKGGYQQGEDIYGRIPIVGVGPGARSYGPNGHYSTEYAVSTRLVNYNIHVWRQHLEQGFLPPLVGFSITPEIRNRSAVILGLMAREGVDRSEIGNDFDPELQALSDLGMVTGQDNILHYTEHGKAYSGALSRLFFGQEIEDKLKSYEHR